MIVQPVQIKTVFTARIRTSGVTIDADDLKNPLEAQDVLAVLSGDKEINFTTGLLRFTFIEDHQFAQPQEPELVAKRHIKRWLYDTLKRYILSNFNFSWEILEMSYEKKDDEDIPFPKTFPE